MKYNAIVISVNERANKNTIFVNVAKRGRVICVIRQMLLFLRK